MPEFDILSPREEEMLRLHFAAKESGTKISYVKTRGKAFYLKLTGDIYNFAHGKDSVIGEGAFGKVSYVKSLSSGALYVLKIIHFSSAKEKELISNELAILNDLSLLHDTASRETAGVGKQYIVMVDAGLSLEHVLMSSPSDEVRIQLAIQLLWALYKLHQGLSSKSLMGIAHRDIKPANLTVTEACEVRLIDVGISSYELDSYPKELAGAPLYLPNMMTLAQGITLRQCDVLAAKRVIYMPDRVLCLEGYREDLTHESFAAKTLFTRPQLEALKILPYFDTKAQAGQNALPPAMYQSNPLILAAVFILARYGLIDDYAESLQNPIVAHAVLGMYWALHERSSERIAAHLAQAIKAYLLSGIISRHKMLAEEVKLYALMVQHGITSCLLGAISNSTLISLLINDSIVIQRAAAKLWQNGYCEPVLLRQLAGNDDLAKTVIDLLCAGRLSEVMSVLTDSSRPSAIHATREVASAKISKVLSTLFIAPKSPTLAELIPTDEIRLSEIKVA